jgi:hypothetical protein
VTPLGRTSLVGESDSRVGEGDTRGDNDGERAGAGARWLFTAGGGSGGTMSRLGFRVLEVVAARTFVHIFDHRSLGGGGGRRPTVGGWIAVQRVGPEGRLAGKEEEEGRSR